MAQVVRPETSGRLDADAAPLLILMGVLMAALARPLLVPGLTAAWLYERSGSIIPAIAAACRLELGNDSDARGHRRRLIDGLDTCHISAASMATPFGHRGQTWARRNEKGKREGKGRRSRAEERGLAHGNLSTDEETRWQTLQ